MIELLKRGRRWIQERDVWSIRYFLGLANETFCITCDHVLGCLQAGEDPPSSLNLTHHFQSFLCQAELNNTDTTKVNVILCSQIPHRQKRTPVLKLVNSNWVRVLQAGCHKVSAWVHLLVFVGNFLWFFCWFWFCEDFSILEGKMAVPRDFSLSGCDF